MFSPFLDLRFVVLENRLVFLELRLACLQLRLACLEQRLLYLESRLMFLESRLVFSHSRLVCRPRLLFTFQPFSDIAEAVWGHRRCDEGRAHFGEQNMLRERAGI